MSENQPKISVIVPVYKAEAYLHRCVDSLLAQTFQDFEILLIDDGSPDCSGKICDEYARKDKRVRVFHKENGGVSSARQCGMDNAQGEYTIHADPDDWVEPNMLEELYKKAKEEDADIVCCNYWEDSSKGSIEYKYDYREETWLQIKNSIPEVLNSSLWNKLIRKNLYDKYNIRLFKGVNMQEDLGVTLRLRMLSRKTVIISKALYHYNKLNTKSMTFQPNLNYVEDQIICASLLEEWFKNNVERHEDWGQLINMIKFLAKSSLFLYPSIQDLKRWKTIFPETNGFVLKYTQLSLFSRIPMWLALHKCGWLGKSLINLKYKLYLLLK